MGGGETWETWETAPVSEEEGSIVSGVIVRHDDRDVEDMVYVVVEDIAGARGEERRRNGRDGKGVDRSKENTAL